MGNSNKSNDPCSDRFVVQTVQLQKNITNGLFIYPLGGHLQWGRNCTAIRIDDCFILLDMGLQFASPKGRSQTPPFEKIEALTKQFNWRGIFVSHAHADHYAAANDCKKYFGKLMPMTYGSGVSCEILHRLQKISRDKLCTVPAGKEIQISKFKVSFIPVQHSIPGTCAILIQSKYGNLLYHTDYKVDYTPVIGLPQLYKKIPNIDIMMVDVTRVTEAITYSESVARAKLFDVLERCRINNRKIINV